MCLFHIKNLPPTTFSLFLDLNGEKVSDFQCSLRLWIPTACQKHININTTFSSRSVLGMRSDCSGPSCSLMSSRLSRRAFSWSHTVAVNKAFYLSESLEQR